MTTDTLITIPARPTVVEVDSWFEFKRNNDGDYRLVGVGRRKEYDALTGKIISDVTSPTGINAAAPAEFVKSLI